MRKIIIGIIAFYQYAISPLSPPTCRFTPSCSSYAREAFFKYGFFKAVWISACRIGRCNPWSSGGYDPVP